MKCRWSAALVIGVLVGILPDVSPPVALAAPPPSWDQATNGEAHRQPAHPKLSSTLEDASTGRRPAPQSASPDAEGRLLVQVDGDDTAAIADAVTANGGGVRTLGPAVVIAAVPPPRLGPLSDDSRVSHVGVPRRPKAETTSEGVHETNADAWQAATPARRGTNVKVGVVDLGFAGLAASAANASVVATNNFCSNFAGDPHGTAVTEIVNEMAPGAQLYLVCVTFDFQVLQAQQWLASQGVTIVNASFADSLDGRGDGSGGPNTLAGAVKAGRLVGQLWSVAAGNEGDRHVLIPVARDIDGDTAVEFGGAGTTPGVDPSEYNSFFVPAGGVVDVGLKWDAWPITNQEFQLCVWRGLSPAGNPTCATNSQGASPGPPVADVFFQNTLSGSTYVAAILRRGAFITPRMDLYFDGAVTGVQRVSAAGSMSEPGSSPWVMSMGAHPVNTSSVEDFSSQGPNIDGRIAPDLSGPDRVSNNVFGSFGGTSAAAPHGTGAAAIVKQMNPSMSPNDIQQFLVGHAVHAGSAGNNNQFGAGMLNLGPLTSTPTGTTPVGAVDQLTGFEGGVAGSGYAFDQDSSVPIRVDVTLDGQPAAPAVSGIARSDVPSPAGSAHGFATSVQAAPGPHTLCFTAMNSPGTLVGPDTSLGCRSAVALAPSAPTARNADFTGDRIADIAVFRPGSPAAQWWITGMANPPILFGDTGAGHNDIPVPGDYLGIGRAVPAVFRQTSPGQWWISGRATPIVFGEPGDIPVPGDYNGDGITDIAVWRPGTPGQFFVNGLPGSTAWGDVRFGDIPVPADYNGDDRTDFAVYRPTSPAQWFVVGLPSPILFGEPGDVPVPNTYHGGARADIAVVRLSGPAEQWFVAGLSAPLFGDSRTGDIPVVADYNADGRADIAVRRPTSPSRWFVNGIGSILWGEPGDVTAAAR